MNLRFSSPLSQLALGTTCHLTIPKNDHVSSKNRERSAALAVHNLKYPEQRRSRNKPDSLLLLLAQALPCFKPAVPDDVDPDQHDLVNLEIFQIRGILQFIGIITMLLI